MRSLSATLSASVLALACVALAALSGCASIPQGRAAVDKVEVTGNKAVDSDDIEDKIATTPSPKFLMLWEGVVFDYEIFDRFVLQRDLARVERFYRARGYYEAHARAGRVEYTKNDHVKVTIEVEEGLPVDVAVVSLEGAETLPVDVQNALKSAIADDVPKDKPLDEDKFEKAEHELQRVLTDHGYAYAQVKRSAYVDLPHHRADVAFGIVPDKLATFGKVTFVGLGELPEDVVRRTFDIQEGTPYSTAKLDDAQQALLDLGVFSSVDIINDLPDPPPANHVVDITVKVERSRLRLLKLGGGVEFDVLKSDVHLKGEWENRNFLGGLRRFNVSFTPGVVLYPMSVSHLVPPTNPLPEEKLKLELQQPAFLEARTHGLARVEANLYPAILVPPKNANDPVLGYREAKGAVGMNRIIWKLFAQVTYNAQYDQPFAFVGQIDSALPSVLLSYVELLTQFDFRDDKVHPHRGVFLGNSLQFAGIGGDAQDVRVQPEVRGYVPVTRKITWGSRVSTGLLFPFNYGSTINSTTPSQVPPNVDRTAWAKDVQLVYFRSFFTGGTTSNRGWPLRGIGPHGIAPFFNPGLAAQQLQNSCTPDPRTGMTPDPVRCATPLGGFTLWEAQTELRFPISGPLTGDGFCDASDLEGGKVKYSFGARRLHLSCGMGLRYDTPVGPIRLDVAYRIPGLNPNDQDIADGLDGSPGAIFGVPIAVAFGIGEAF